MLASSLVLITSCKKTGCTDSTALNYSEEAKKDDGSCITVQDIRNTDSQNLYVEVFNLTFSNSVSYTFYNPNFNYENGDMIIIEVLNQYGEWKSLPAILDVDVHLEGSYEDDGTIWIYLKNDDGSSFYPSGNATVSFRAGLVKKNGMILNPNIEGKTISEIKQII